MVFEELREQRAIGGRAGDLIVLDPPPQGPPRYREFCIAVRLQRVVQAQDIGHVAGHRPATRSGAIVGAKRPGRMGAVARLLIGGQNAGVLQSLLQILALAAGLEQQHQRITGNATLVRLDLVGMIAL